MASDLGAYLARRYSEEFAPGTDPFRRFVQRRNGASVVDLDGYLTWVSQHPHQTPGSPLENSANAFLAKEIMAAATGKHVGRVEETETYFLQYNVNYFNQPVTVLLIGGTIYQKCRDRQPGYQEDLAVIAEGVLYNAAEGHYLRPNGRVLLDARYLVSILGGLYGRVAPEQALRMMKRELLSLESVLESKMEKVAAR
jgi:hypothetical protein